jgi:hypothetical protein
MTEVPKFRYYQLKGEGLELLKAYRAELDALIDDRDALATEFAERSQQQSDYHNAKLRTLWQKMTALVGLDHDSTWGSPEYQIETRFFDAGFGALLFIPRPANPLAQMLEGLPIGEEQDPENDIPDDETTRH